MALQQIGSTVTITTPPFSLYQFNQPATGSCVDSRRCLPVYQAALLSGTDIYFQCMIAATGDAYAKLYDGMGPERGTPQTAVIDFFMIDTGACDLSGISNDRLANKPDFTLTLNTLNPEVAIPGQQFLAVATPLFSGATLPAYPVGHCFKLIAVYKVYGDGGQQTNTILGCSNCFVKINDPCYTTLLQYTNTGNAFGWYFAYAQKLNIPTTEIVRLPMYLHSPVNTEEEHSYEKSDGSTTKLSHRIWKEYQFKTDYLPGDWLEKLNIITALNSIQYTNPFAGVTNQLFVRKEKIDIDWQQDTTPFITLAQGRGRLRMATARANVNSN